MCLLLSISVCCILNPVYLWRFSTITLTIVASFVVTLKQSYQNLSLWTTSRFNWNLTLCFLPVCDVTLRSGKSCLQSREVQLSVGFCRWGKRTFRGVCFLCACVRGRDLEGKHWGKERMFTSSRNGIFKIPVYCVNCVI